MIHEMNFRILILLHLQSARKLPRKSSKHQLLIALSRSSSKWKCSWKWRWRKSRVAFRSSTSVKWFSSRRWNFTITRRRKAHWRRQHQRSSSNTGHRSPTTLMESLRRSLSYSPMNCKLLRRPFPVVEDFNASYLCSLTAWRRQRPAKFRNHNRSQPQAKIILRLASIAWRTATTKLPASYRRTCNSEWNCLFFKESKLMFKAALFNFIIYLFIRF